MPMNSVVNAFVSGTILFSMAGGPFLIIFGFPALLWRFVDPFTYPTLLQLLSLLTEIRCSNRGGVWSETLVT
jgi:hypothetical protein